MKTAPLYIVTYNVRPHGDEWSEGKPTEFSVPCWERSTKAIFDAWKRLYGKRWDAAGLVSIFAGRDKRQVWAKEIGWIES